MRFGRLRSFILSNEAAAELDKAAAEVHRVEEEMRGVEWVLIRAPHLGSQVGPDVYLYVNRKASSTASLITVLYSYDEDKVEVLRLWIR